jgi:hypothetical protein
VEVCGFQEGRTRIVLSVAFMGCRVHVVRTDRTEIPVILSARVFQIWKTGNFSRSGQKTGLLRCGVDEPTGITTVQAESGPAQDLA